MCCPYRVLYRIIDSQLLLFQILHVEPACDPANSHSFHIINYSLLRNLRQLCSILLMFCRSAEFGCCLLRELIQHQQDVSIINFVRPTSISYAISVLSVTHPINTSKCGQILGTKASFYFGLVSKHPTTRPKRVYFKIIYFAINENKSSHLYN